MSYLPQLIVYIVGAVVAIGMLSRHRKLAMLVLIAMSLGLVGTLIWPVYRFMAPNTGIPQYWQLLRWTSVAISVAVTILLLLAAFSNRHERYTGGGFEISPTGGQQFGGPPTPPPIRTSQHL